MKINKIYIGISILLALTLLSSFVSAFGVGYVWGSPIKMYPGESQDLYITLNNWAGSEDITAKTELLGGAEIVELTDENPGTYFIPHPGETQVNFTVTIPEDDPIGKSYEIKLRFVTVPDKESGGMFAMGTGQRIFINVGEKPAEKPVEKELAEEKGKTEILAIALFAGLAIIIISIILITLIRKRKKQ